jgi:hypothetical protein
MDLPLPAFPPSMPGGRHPYRGGDVEIKTFGLLPEFTGKGPNALPNYHRRGFRTFRTEQHDG